MAKKSKKPNRTDLTLRNLHAYKRDLKLITDALKSIDRRIGTVEAQLLGLVSGALPVIHREADITDGPPPTDDGA